MLIPTLESGQPRPWTFEKAYEGLLYFAQLMHEMLYYGAAEPFRVVSLDTFHRLVEFERTWKELNSAGLTASGMDMMLKELLDYSSRDPLVKRDYLVEWDAIQSRLNSFGDRPVEALEAVRYFWQILAPSYLGNCQGHIIEFAASDALKNRRDFRFLCENYCSFLLNSGHQPHEVFWRIQKQFYEREVNLPVKRELENFFRFFPCKARKFRVVMAASEDFVPVLQARSEVQSLGPNLPMECRKVKQPFSKGSRPHLFQIEVNAFDRVDARVRGEQQLTMLRAVAYTTTPAAILEWDPHVLVWEVDDSRAVKMSEGVDVLRRMRRRTARAETEIAKRQRFFFDQFETEIDRNRVTNFVTIYASAFHSESSATQLLSLWASLEGLLPEPSGSKSRIESFSRDVVACQKQIYLAGRFEALYQELYATFGQDANDLLRDVEGISSSYDNKLAAVVCLKENEEILDQLGAMCGANPLGRQRLFEINKASSSCGDLFGLVAAHAKKVEWQLHRIYRERNRIVHQANPSPNVEALILSLNAYILGVVEALVGNDSPEAGSLDQGFANIRIAEEAREKAVGNIKKVPIDKEKLGIVISRI